MSDRPLIWYVGGEDVHRRIPLLKRLEASGYRVGAVGSQNSAPFDAAKIAYHRYELARHLDPLSDLKSVRQLTALFRSGRPDLIHAFDTKPAIYAMAAGKRAGVRGLVRTITGLGYLFSEESRKTSILRHIYGTLHRQVRGAVSWTIFQNPDDQSLFHQLGLVSGNRTSVVLGSGIDVAEVDTLLKQSPDTASIRESLGLVGRKVALLPSRLIKHKGVMEFIGAARRLHQEDSSVIFLLAGPIDGEGQFAVTKGDIETGGAAVRYIGNRSDVLAIMNASDVVVLPSYYREGVPRSLLEAAAIGIPIVTADVPGSREVVVDGKSGWIVPPRDETALAAAISKAFALSLDARSAFRSTARDHVVRNFELSLVTERYAEIYKEVLARPATPSSNS